MYTSGRRCNLLDYVLAKKLSFKKEGKKREIKKREKNEEIEKISETIKTRKNTLKKEEKCKFKLSQMSENKIK